MDWIFAQDQDGALPAGPAAPDGSGEVYAESSALLLCLIAYQQAVGGKAFFSPDTYAVQGGYFLEFGDRQPPDQYRRFLREVDCGGAPPAPVCLSASLCAMSRLPLCHVAPLHRFRSPFA